MKKVIVLICVIVCSSFSSNNFSWSGLSSNQTVSFANALDAVNTSVFTAKTTITSSSKLMTKAEAATYLYIDETYASFAAKSSGQLIVKDDLVPAGYYVIWAHNVSGGPSPWASSAIACTMRIQWIGEADLGFYILSSHDPIVGDRPPNGAGYFPTGWYLITHDDDPTFSWMGGVKKAWHFDASGYIDSIVTC